MVPTQWLMLRGSFAYKCVECVSPGIVGRGRESRASTCGLERREREREGSRVWRNQTTATHTPTDTPIQQTHTQMGLGLFSSAPPHNRLEKDYSRLFLAISCYFFGLLLDTDWSLYNEQKVDSVFD